MPRLSNPEHGITPATSMTRELLQKAAQRFYTKKTAKMQKSTCTSTGLGPKTGTTRKDQCRYAAHVQRLHDTA